MTAETKAILAIIDPTVETQPGLERAAWIAARFGLPLELLICTYDTHLAGESLGDAPTLEAARRALLHSHRERLRGLQDQIARSGLEVGIDVRWAHPLEHGIAQKVIESRPALVVKDTHSHTRLKRSILSNTDWNLIRYCPAPLWLVKPRPIASTPVLLAAVDPLNANDKPALLDHAILTIAQELRAAMSAELHVCHAYTAATEIVAETDTIATPIPVPIAPALGAAQAAHRAALDRLVRPYAIAPARAHLVEGLPHEVLLTLAAQLNADVVVMGAVARRALEHAWVGSTAERTLDRLPCDLIVVKLT